MENVDPSEAWTPARIGWTSPTLSFSEDLAMIDKMSPENRKREQTILGDDPFEFANSVSVDVRSGDRMLPAEELFLEGKLLPFSVRNSPRFVPEEFDGARVHPLCSSMINLHNPCCSSPPPSTPASPKASSNCSMKLKDLFKLKKFHAPSVKDAASIEIARDTGSASITSSFWPFSRSKSGRPAQSQRPWFLRSNSAGGERKSSSSSTQPPSTFTPALSKAKNCSSTAGLPPLQTPPSPTAGKGLQSDPLLSSSSVGQTSSKTTPCFPASLNCGRGSAVDVSSNLCTSSLPAPMDSPRSLHTPTFARSALPYTPMDSPPSLHTPTSARSAWQSRNGSVQMSADIAAAGWRANQCNPATITDYSSVQMSADIAATGWRANQGQCNPATIADDSCVQARDPNLWVAAGNGRFERPSTGSPSNSTHNFYFYGEMPGKRRNSFSNGDRRSMDRGRIGPKPVLRPHEILWSREGKQGCERPNSYISRGTVTPILNVPGCPFPRKSKPCSKSQNASLGSLFSTGENSARAYHVLHETEVKA